jgi:transcriptional regulator with XRE-family HTH domain
MTVARSSRAATRVSLGTLVRARREHLRLSMDDLALRARVSRSTLHRIEHDHDIRPTAAKLAQILTVLEVEPTEVRDLIADDDYLGDILHWMERSGALVEVTQSLRPQPSLAALAADQPSLIAMKDNHIATISGTGLEEIREALKAAGWLVARPE